MMEDMVVVANEGARKEVVDANLPSRDPPPIRGGYRSLALEVTRVLPAPPVIDVDWDKCTALPPRIQRPGVAACANTDLRRRVVRSTAGDERGLSSIAKSPPVGQLKVFCRSCSHMENSSHARKSPPKMELSNHTQTLSPSPATATEAY